MLKLMIGLMVMFLTGTCAFAQEVSTRFGVLSVNEDKMLLFRGRPLTPPIQGNNSLDISKPFTVGSTDVMLVTDNGGTACPFLYYFVSVSKSGAKATPVFGTCGEATNVKLSDDSIHVTMPGFLGPFERQAAQRRAARERHVFIFRAGVVTENGKAVK
jgi:hypothetical protein